MRKHSFIFISVIFFACAKQHVDKDVPRCIQKSIKEFSQQGCSDKSIRMYLFQGKEVYVYEAGTCGADMTSAVVDRECNALGYLGGISGNFTINGEKFSNATFVKTIWSN